MRFLTKLIHSIQISDILSVLSQEKATPYADCQKSAASFSKKLICPYEDFFLPSSAAEGWISTEFSEEKDLQMVYCTHINDRHIGHKLAQAIGYRCFARGGRTGED